MNYTGLDEVIVSFIDDMLYYALIFGIAVIINLWGENMIKKTHQLLQESLKKIDPSSSQDLANLSLEFSANCNILLGLYSQPRYKKILELLKSLKSNHDNWHSSNIEAFNEIRNLEIFFESKKGSETQLVHDELDKLNKLNSRKNDFLNKIRNSCEEFLKISDVIKSSTQSLDLNIKKKKLLISILLFLCSLGLLLFIPLRYSLKFTILSTLIYIFLTILLAISQNTRLETNYYIIIIMGILIYTVCGAFHDSYYVKETSDKTIVNIKFKDNTLIKTDSNYIYLGKTNNYVFFYNLKEKESEVYNSSDISIIKTHKSK